LYDTGKIGDPLYRYNDLELRYLSKDDNWVFTKTFRLNSNDVQNAKSISLTFDSVDTLSSIYLNKKLILNTDNQFLQYRVNDIKPLLEEENTLEVKFLSPVVHAKKAHESYPYRMPPECPPDVQKGECHVNMLRKKQCSFSWDWGPTYPNIGVNGPVYLTFLNSFDFEFSVSVYPQVKRNLNSWYLDHLLTVRKADSNKQKVTVKAKIEELGFEQSADFDLNQKEQELLVKLPISNSNIKLWWPNGNGEPKMYELKIEVKLNEESIMRSKKIGFRSVELVEELTPSGKPEHGLTFYFKVNNVDLFLKGSNWIPADVFQEKITRAYMEDLFHSAKESHMNVLRIWGGGIYELDDFYDIANEYGILIWQDFMFACAAYPTNKEYLDNVKKEVAYQVNRLRHHPCILIWAGNNENEAAISTNWYGTDSNKTVYHDDYRKLYIDTIKPIVEKYDPEISRPYLSSSPTNGVGSAKENWLAKNPYDWNYGDVHFYDYKMNSWNPNNFPLPRVMSEFGVQSLPSPSTLSKSFIYEEDMDLESKLTEHRQHHGNGNQEMIDEIKNNLDMPTDLNIKTRFVKQIYLTQLNQGMHVGIGNELYRRSRNFFNTTNGNGLCSGTMYWQFNDLWQAPTWATIEYGGKWKLSHYFVKRSYEKLHLTPVLNNTEVTIHAISDHMSDVSSQFDVKIYSYDSLKAKMSQSYKFSIEPLTAKPVVSIKLDEIEKKTGCKFNADSSCVLVLTSNDNQFAHKDFINFLLFKTRLADVKNLQVPDLRIDSVRQLDDNGNFEISLSTNQVAVFVWLDTNTDRFKGIFSDNGFHMVDKERKINFKTNDRSVSKEDLQKNLFIHALNNSFLTHPSMRVFAICLFFIYWFF